MLATSTVNPHHQGKKTIIILVVEMCAAVSKVTAGRCCHLRGGESTHYRQKKLKIQQ